jgi:hypothetical protein
MHRMRLSLDLTTRRSSIASELPAPVSSHARHLVENFAALN